MIAVDSVAIGLAALAIAFSSFSIGLNWKMSRDRHRDRGRH